MRRPVLFLAALLALAASRNAAADFAYSIGDGGASLLRFDTANPNSATRVGFFGGADSFLDSIDFRPATGQLYGYRDATDTYFTVDLATGALTAAGTGAGAPTNTFLLGMDFNPTIDRLRVVTDSTQNIVFNPVAGTAAPFTPLFYAAGDVNAGLTPRVIENAYTNNIVGLGTTQQYVLDYDLNVLATLANNAGTLNTIGNVTLNGVVFDFNEYVGFDIFTAPNLANTAYALLSSANTGPTLYTLDLSSGALTTVGTIGGGAGNSFGLTYGLAVVPVPEPTALAAMAIGLGTLGLAAFRRRRSLS